MAQKTVTGLKTKLLLSTAGALFLLALTFPAQAGFASPSADAGTAGLVDRLNQIENQIQTLSRAVYRNDGSTPPPAASGGVAAEPLSGAGLSSYMDRLVAVEEQQRSLTGQLEEMNNQLRQIQTRMDKMQGDYDSRLQGLEHGGSAGGSYVAPGSSSSASSAAGAGTGEASASSFSLSPKKPQGSSEHTLGTIAASGNGSSADSLYEDAFSDVRNAKYDSAETKLKQFMSQYPGHPLTGNAQYWLAETYYVRGDYQKAAKAFAQGYQDYPQGAKAGDSLLKLGLSLAKLGKKDDACLSLQQLKKSFPADSNPAGRRAVQEMKNIGCAE